MVRQLLILLLLLKLLQGASTWVVSGHIFSFGSALNLDHCASPTTVRHGRIFGEWKPTGPFHVYAIRGSLLAFVMRIPDRLRIP